jgi:hypothetical protein
MDPVRRLQLAQQRPALVITPRGLISKNPSASTSANRAGTAPGIQPTRKVWSSTTSR